MLSMLIFREETTLNTNIKENVCMWGGDSKSNMGRLSEDTASFYSNSLGCFKQLREVMRGCPHLCWRASSPNSLSLAEDAECNLPCPSLQVSALHTEHDNQLLGKGRRLPIHLPRIFPRQEILKGFKSESLAVYTDPATDMLLGLPPANWVQPTQKGSCRGTCAITVEYGILK